MIEHILAFISELSPFWIYVTLFLFSYIENIFPPSPSDLVIVVGGSLVSIGTIHFIPALLMTAIGGLLGFMSLFFVGTQLDKKIIRTKKIKFISVESLDKAEKWFTRYGYYIIAFNRFLPGTRSVISVFAGLSELDPKKTTILAALSTSVWNAGVIYLGIIFGRNVSKVDYYLGAYSNGVLFFTVIIIVLLIFRYIYNQRKKKSS
jgi:membrane protein DedA with SNARE-associated domain